MDFLWIILAAVGGIVVGVLVVVLVPFFKQKGATNKANRIVRDAEIKAEHIIKNAQLDGKQAAQELKSDVEKEIKERKQEVAQLENKLFQREQNIDRRDSQL